MATERRTEHRLAESSSGVPVWQPASGKSWEKCGKSKDGDLLLQNGPKGSPTVVSSHTLMVDITDSISPRHFRLCLKQHGAHQWGVTLPLTTSSWKAALVRVNKHVYVNIYVYTHTRVCVCVYVEFEVLCPVIWLQFLFRCGDYGHCGNLQPDWVGGVLVAVQ